MPQNPLEGLKKAISIGPDPQGEAGHGFARQALEALTGYPADPNTQLGPVDVLIAGLPFAHNLKQIRRIAGGYGRVPLYHGTTADNAANILQQGYKLPASGESAAMDMAKRYDIPWAEWKHRVEPNGLGSNYGNATQKLSTGPFSIAERWAGNFPQGEINSDLNTKARLYSEAKRRGIPYDDMFNQAGDAADAAGTPNYFKYPDAVGAPDLMAPKRQGGVVLENVVDARDIPNRTKREAINHIRYGDDKKDTIRSWNNTYQDIKIDPRKIKNTKVVKGKIEGPEG